MLSWMKNPRRLLAIAMIGMVLIFAGMLSVSLWISHKQALSLATANSQNLSLALAENMSETFLRVDTVLRDIEEGLEDALAAGKNPGDKSQKLFLRAAERMDDIAVTRFADAEGNVAPGNGFPEHSPGISIADRDYFLALKAKEAQQESVSKPLLGRTAKKWLIVFARRVDLPGGKFAGVVYAGISVDDFTRIFGALNLGNTGAVILIDDQLFISARYPPPPDPASLGKKISQPWLVSLLSSGTNQLTATFVPAMDSIERVYSFRRIKDWPWWVSVGIGTREALNGWYQQLWSYLAVFFLFTGMFIMVSWQLFRSWDRQKKNLEELRASRDELAKAQESAHLGSWKWFVESNRVEWSDQMLRIFGLSRERFDGRLDEVIARSIHPDDRAMVEASNQRVRGEGKFTAMEFRIVRADGEIRTVWVEAGKLFLDGKGRPEKLIGYLQDITERKKSENALLEQKRFAEEIFNSTDDHLAVIGYDGTILMVNQAWERFAVLSGGTGSEKFCREGENYFAACYPGNGADESGKQVVEGIQRVQNGSLDVFSMDYRFDMATEPLFFNLRAIAMPGTSRRVLLSHRDITNRKLAEKALLESERKLRMIFDTMSEGVALNQIVLDEFGDMKDYRIVDVNRAFYDTADYGGRDVIGRLASDIYAMSNDAIQDFWLSHKGVTEVQRTEYVSPVDGRCFTLATSPFTEGYFVTTLFDITERKKTEEEIIRMNRALEEIVNQKIEEIRIKDHILDSQARQALMGEMLHNIAHQWRQPLNAVGLVLQNLEAKYENGTLNAENLSKSVFKGMELVQYMSRTIDDFRNFFRVDKEKRDFSVHRAFQETLSLMQASLNHNQIPVEMVESPEFRVTGYPNEYGQVLLNLMNNAKDALITRKVEKPVIRCRFGTEEGMGFLALSDNAGGIPEEILSKIGTPYFTTKQEGTGIGIYMSRSIIEKNMGGKLLIRNIPGGLEVRVMVPLANS